MNLHSPDTSFKNLARFSTRVLVQCPHCGKAAAVVSQLPGYYVPYPPPGSVNHKFNCSHCYKPLDENRWYGKFFIFTETKQCGNCGSGLPYREQLVDKRPDKINITCPACLQQRPYETGHRLAYADSYRAVDPYLGLPLWLQTVIDNHVFWAYNFEHLAYLKQYIASKNRPAVEGGKYSLVWKLPNFVKTAKNRDKIIKAIERFEKQGG